MVQRHLIAALFCLGPLYAYSCAPAAFLLDRFSAAYSVSINSAVRRPAFAAEYRSRAEKILKRLDPKISAIDLENGCAHAYFDVTAGSRPLLEALLRFAEGGPPILMGNVEVPGANVSLTTRSGVQSTTANQDGHFFFPLAHPGRYRIEAYKSGLRIAFRTFDDGYLDEFEIPTNTSANLDGMRVHAPGLAGRFLTPTGTPIPNARITAIRPGETYGRLARTNASGHFHLPNLDPGPYQLVAASSTKQPDPRFRSSYYANKATLEFPKNGHGKQEIEFRAAPTPKLIPIRAFLTRGSYSDHHPGQKITFRLHNANSHVNLLDPEIDFSCTIDSALSCFIPLVEGELYRPPGVLLPEWTVRATPGGYIHLP